MRTEEDIRAAFRVLAADAPDLDTVLAGIGRAQDRQGDQPGPLAVAYPARTGRSRPGRRSSPRRLAPPIAAAAAVLAIIGVAVALSAGGARRLSASSAQGASNRAMAQLNQVPDAAADTGLPRYYVMDDLGARQPWAVIGDLDTGATIPVNLPGFSVVSAAASADDRTFALEVYGHGRSYLYLARLDAETGTVSLSRLPIARPGQSVGFSFGLSPSGTALAVAFINSSPTPGRLVSAVEIYSLSGTLLRAWRTSNGYVCDPGPMSWAQNGLLMFGTRFQQDHYGECLLNVTSRGGSLRSATRMVVPRLGPGWTVQNASLAGDGQTIAAAVAPTGRNGTWEFVVFSAATGHVGQPMLVNSGFGEFVLWDSYSGGQQIAYAPVNVRAKHLDYQYGVLANGRFAPFRYLLHRPPLAEFAF
jgi:hypothetical protein